MMMSEHLAGAGCDEFEVENADAAFGLLEKKASKIQVLFTDTHMPGWMDGLALAHHARRKWPWISSSRSGRRAPPQ